MVGVSPAPPAAPPPPPPPPPRPRPTAVATLLLPNFSKVRRLWKTGDCFMVTMYTAVPSSKARTPAPPANTPRTVTAYRNAAAAARCSSLRATPIPSNLLGAPSPPQGVKNRQERKASCVHRPWEPKTEPSGAGAQRRATGIAGCKLMARETGGRPGERGALRARRGCAAPGGRRECCDFARLEKKGKHQARRERRNTSNAH